MCVGGNELKAHKEPSAPPLSLSLSPSPEVTDKEFSMNTVAAEAESEALNHLNQADTSSALGDG